MGTQSLHLYLTLLFDWYNSRNIHGSYNMTQIAIACIPAIATLLYVIGLWTVVAILIISIKIRLIYKRKIPMNNLLASHLHYM